MSTASYAIQDSATMLRRNLRRTLRYPASAAATIGIPIVFLLLFVFVFGDTLGAGLAAVSGGRDEYLDYVTPGIIVLAAAGAAQGCRPGCAGSPSISPSPPSWRLSADC
jgi:ABC-2 type transport system permease protein